MVRSRGAISPRAKNATAVPIRTMAMSRKMITSDLDLDDPLDDQRAGDGPSGRETDHDLASGRGEKRVHVVRVLELDDDEQEDGEQRDDPAGQLSLDSQRLDQPLQIEPLANRLGHAVYDLS